MITQRRLVLACLVLDLIVPSGAFPSSARAIELTCPPPATSSTEAAPASATPTPDIAFPDEDTEITVFAAASLTDAYTDIADTIEQAHPNIRVIVETAGSQTLVTQLIEGAQADVLATADTITMQRAQDGGMITGKPAVFASNRLVIVTPQDNPAGIQNIEDLAKDDIRLVVAGEEVPAGRYAREAFCTWADEDLDLLAAIGANVASEEIDVRTVMTRVQLGEADAGIVYTSDAAASELAGTPMNVVEFPENVSTSVSYPIASVTGGDEGAAKAFIAYVLSSDGQRILKQYGFRPPS